MNGCTLTRLLNLAALLFTLIALAMTHTPLHAADAAASGANLLPAGSDWKVLQGRSEPGDAGHSLIPGVTLTRSVKLSPGLYELQVTGSGSGLISLLGGGQRRTLRAAAKPGIYGLLFEVAAEQEITLTLTYHDGGKDRFVLTGTDLVSADVERQAAWAAAKESFQRLGYFGTDPQRAAPGETRAPMTEPTPADLERWAIRESVVFYDEGFDSWWVQDAAKVADFYVRRGMASLNAVQTEAWLKQRATGDAGVGSSIIFTMGVVPQNVVYQPYMDCLLARYMRAGGRVVFLANLPMYVSQGAKGPAFMYGHGPSEQLLGLTTDRKSFYGLEGPTLTPAARAWGIVEGSQLIRPVHARGVSIPFVVDPTGEYCGVGLVNLRSDLPFSGFIFVPDQAQNFKHDWLLPNVYRMAWYSGKTVTIPQPKPLPAPAVPLVAAVRFGAEDLRMVYLRGEIVPLVLRARALAADLNPVAVRYTLRDAEQVLLHNSVEISVTEKESDQLVGHLDLGGLRVGRYSVALELEAKGKTLKLERELRVGPKPDHAGFHYGIWCGASPRVNRTEDLIDDLMAHNMEPVWVDDESTGADLALWYGLSFSTRRHGEPDLNVNPPGYNNDRLGSSGQVLRLGSMGGRRVSKGYSSPFRRQAEADEFSRYVIRDAKFPAFNQRVATADDYSQFLGMDYNRFVVEGFKARYGIDVPRPEGTEDPYTTPNITREPGVIPDDDAWVLLNEYWCQNFGDAGRRFSKAMEAATGGAGKVGPVPGGMQLPVMSIWSAQYPPLAFGPRGFNLSSFYYYNSFWQPPLANVWWLEVARMGNPGIEQMIYTDCYQMHLESFHRNNVWLILSGGVQNIAYFCYDERKPAAMQALKHWGGVIQRYGQLLRQLRPEHKKIAMLVPLENVTYRIEHNYMMGFPFMNMLMAKADVEPVSPHGLDAAGLDKYELVVLAQTLWLKQSTVKMLEDYINRGGKVAMDQLTSQVISIRGATNLDVSLGETHNGGYAQPNAIAQVRQALHPLVPPVIDCADPLVTVRRAALDDGTPAAWFVHNYSQAEFDKLRAGKDSLPDAARALEDSLGYRRDIVETTFTRADDGRVPFDVFGGKPLPVTRENGVMTVRLTMAKWDGVLVLFLPFVPEQVTLTTLAEQATPGVPLSLQAQLRSAKGDVLTTPSPLKLTVRDPKGQVSREYSRRLMTRDGIVDHHVTFAVNDLPGAWTLEVQDVLTGQKASTVVQLKAP